MFECSLDGLTLKRIFEALKDTCAEVNFVCDADGCTMQAMDDSHVALVSTTWGVDMFHKYRCDSQVTLGELDLPKSTSRCNCPSLESCKLCNNEQSTTISASAATVAQ